MQKCATYCFPINSLLSFFTWSLDNPPKSLFILWCPKTWGVRDHFSYESVLESTMNTEQCWGEFYSLLSPSAYCIAWHSVSGQQCLLNKGLKNIQETLLSHFNPYHFCNLKLGVELYLGESLPFYLPLSGI